MDSSSRQSLWWGLLGVLGFSLTLPATRMAVVDLDPVFIGLGRAEVAAVLAALVLWLTRIPWPQGGQWWRLVGVALGVVVGFPLCSTLAMASVPASHGAVVVGLLPLATALFGAWLAGERPAPLFWFSTLVGSGVIAAFSLQESHGALQPADLWLLGAVATAGFGYAEGARLSKELGAWQTVSWALVLAAPVLLIPTVLTAPTSPGAVGLSSWVGFAYVAVVSMYLAFFAWYKGLAMGGIARVGQIQLLQPFFTMLAAAWLLGEVMKSSQWLAALAVLGCVALGRRATAPPPVLPALAIEEEG